MNEPIINPWLIYLVYVLAGIKTATLFGWIVSIGAFIVFVIERSDTYDEVKIIKIDKWLYQTAMAFCVLVSMYILVPHKTVCWQMLVASKVTPATIQMTGEVAEDATKKALDLITDSVIKIMQEAKK